MMMNRNNLPEEIYDLLAPLRDLDKQGWNDLERYIDEAQDGFVRRFRADYPRLTEEGIQVAMLIRLGLCNEEIAHLGNVKLESLRMKYYRMKLQMGEEGGVHAHPAHFFEASPASTSQSDYLPLIIQLFRLDNLVI